MEKKYLIDGKIIPTSNLETTFSFKLPSPKWASDIFNLWLFLGALALLYNSFFPLPPATETSVLKVMAFGTAALRLLAKALGLKIKENPLT